MQLRLYLSTLILLLLFPRMASAADTLRVANPAANRNPLHDTIRIRSVVITATPSPRPLKRTPIPIRVLGAKQLIEAGYTNLQQALQQETAGLSIQKVGYGNEIALQGLDARHILFLIDGERMTGEMAGNIDYERLNLHALSRVEILKGASSTLYGSRATGAVINLITKRTVKAFDMQIGARYAQANEINYSAPSTQDFLYMYERNADRPNLQAWMSLGAKLGKLTTQTDAAYASTDAYFLYQKERDRKVYTREANDFLQHDTTIVADSPRPPMGISGSEHLSLAQKLYYDPTPWFSLLSYANAFFMNTYDLVPDLRFSQSEDWGGGLKATTRLYDRVTINASIHYDHYKRHKRHERRDTRSTVYKSRLLQPRLTLQSHFFPLHSLAAGAEYTSDMLTSDRFDDANRLLLTRSLREFEAYAQDDWRIANQWLLSTGVRTNYSRVYGLYAMPKLALKFTPTTRWTLRANYSHGYRSPSIKELFFNWDHLAMFRIRGNAHLRPERNHYVSLGFDYDSPHLFLALTAYANNFQDKIEGVWRIYDMQYNFEYTNLGHQDLRGIEAIARARLPLGFALNASYSYVHISALDGLRVSSTSPHAATASCSYTYARPRYRLNAVLSASYTGAKRFDIQDRLTPHGHTASFPAYFRCELPPYVLLNLALNQTFYGCARVALGVNNLLNYKPSTLGSGVTIFSIPATPGIRFHLQIELQIDSLIQAFS